MTRRFVDFARWRGRTRNADQVRKLFEMEMYFLTLKDHYVAIKACTAQFWDQPKKDMRLLCNGDIMRLFYMTDVSDRHLPFHPSERVYI